MENFRASQIVRACVRACILSLGVVGLSAAGLSACAMELGAEGAEGADEVAGAQQALSTTEQRQVVYAVIGGELRKYQRSNYSHDTSLPVAPSGPHAWPVQGLTIGYGWTAARSTSDQRGNLFVLDSDNNLRWYQDTDANAESSWPWAPGSGNVVGWSWGGVRLMAGSGDRALYVVVGDQLLWYGYTGHGEFSWHPSSGMVVGPSGWSTVQEISAYHNTLFARMADGTIHQYLFSTGAGQVPTGGDPRNGALVFSPGGAPTRLVATGRKSFFLVYGGALYEHTLWEEFSDDNVNMNERGSGWGSALLGVGLETPLIRPFDGVYTIRAEGSGGRYLHRAGAVYAADRTSPDACSYFTIEGGRIYDCEGHLECYAISRGGEWWAPPAYSLVAGTGTANAWAWSWLGGTTWEIRCGEAYDHALRAESSGALFVDEAGTSAERRFVLTAQ